MKYSSIQRLITESGKVLNRFPLEAFFAFAGSCAATVLIEVENNNQQYSTWCWRIIMAANLGLLLSLSASLFSDSRSLSFNKKLFLYFISLLISILFLFVFNPVKRESDIIRFFMVSFAFHLLVSFVPFIYQKDHINAFWQFNKTLFLRFLAGALYSGVLYIGLCSALASTKFLFNFDWGSDAFLIMGVWIFGMFQTLFFLSGVPVDIKSLQQDLSYPKGLKLFTQYVLIPLASIYAAILLSYELKILLQWNMPKGLVSSLILGYAVFGILSFLLIYPLRNLDGHKWIRKYSKNFYFLLLPLLVLLYLAILTRIEKYGITEDRYFLIILAVWLSFITGYFLLSKRENIMVIPVTLSIITIIGVYGPLSAFNIAEKSQLQQLKKILIINKALNNGKLKPLTETLDSIDNQRIKDVSAYILTKYGLESLQPIIKEDLTKVRDSIIHSLNRKTGRVKYSRWQLNESEQNWLYKNYKLPVHYNYDIVSPKGSYMIVAENEELIPLNSADFLVDINFNNYNKDDTTIKLEKDKSLYYNISDSIIRIRIEDDSVKINLVPLLNRVHKEISRINAEKKNTTRNNTGIIDTSSEQDAILPRTELTLQVNLGDYKLSVLLNRIQYISSGSKKSILSGNGMFLLKRNN